MRGPRLGLLLGELAGWGLLGRGGGVRSGGGGGRRIDGGCTSRIRSTFGS